MDLGDGSVRSRSEEEGRVEKATNLVEIGHGMNGSSSVSGVGGSVNDSVELETLEKSADVVENPGINGHCIDANRKIVESVEMNGEIVGIEKAVVTPSRGIGSPEENSKRLEDMGSQSKSKEAEKVENLEVGVQFDETKLDVNGPVNGEVWDLDRNRDLNGKGIEIQRTMETSPMAMESPPGGSGASSTRKGHGLKKWRRIRRNPTKDGGGVADPNRILKRVLSNAEPEKARLVENKQKSEGSCSSVSVNSAMKNLGFSQLPVGLSDTEFKLDVETAFAIGADSDNSEDHSSKCSTAASAPRSRLEGPVAAGFTKDKSKVKNASGRSSGNAVHRAQQGKAKVEATKKPRGERIKVEKENSYSSVESDLRSSNAVFIEVGALSRVTETRQREGFSNYDGENSEEVGIDYYKQNGEEIEVVSRDVLGCVLGVKKNEESKNHRPHMDHDPLAESIILLQAAQEALKKEIQMFGEIGIEPVLLPDSPSCGVSSSAQVPTEEMEENNSVPTKAQLVKLSQKVSLLEHELEEASANLKAKESKALELVSLLNTTQSPKEGMEEYLASLQNLHKEMDIELEGLFKNKMEAEVEYLMMVRNTHGFRITAEDQRTLVEQQKSLAENQAQFAVKLGDAEDKVAMLRRRVEELEAYRRELLETKDVLKVKNDVCAHASVANINLYMCPANSSAASSTWRWVMNGLDLVLVAMLVIAVGPTWGWHDRRMEMS
ncbi:WPP domain-containing protein [Cinnamomum micranthum f. kanehirae]|uniref:WPP domain-containing protein n=1 Tax=Cinnamomum micranthum f. kanehirae TaxID=337451 RepID=A0A443NEM7_9MAGN|nr:WPP domain-containing protein [Cinnamomum micranthum f. kanehirae]